MFLSVILQFTGIFLQVVKEKPKRKTPLDHVPSSTEEWAVYDAPEEALEAFRHKMMKTTGINSNNISKPVVFSRFSLRSLKSFSLNVVSISSRSDQLSKLSKI